MKFHSLRTSLVGSAFALIAAVLLGSCGGGGAESNNTGSALQILPTNATFYAGIENTMVVTGGRRPYILTSSEPGLMPVPSTINSSSFTVVPGNPGVIDVGITPGSLPVRTVNVTATDANGATATAAIRVAQNFLTGYGVLYTSNCLVTGTAAAPAACAAGETTVRIEPTFNGLLFGNRTLRLEVMRGPFKWVFPTATLSADGSSVTVTTDHEGKASAVFRVDANVPTQVGLFRIVDVETGVSTEESFLINGTPLAAALTVIPDTFTFTGANTAQCGTGSARFLVFDGLPPYTATSSFGQVTVSPSTSTDQPGVFTFSVNDPNTCLTDATIVVTDARLAHGTVTITSAPGTAAPPPLPLRAVPSSMTLTCGQTGSTIVTGGASGATISAISNDPNLTIVVAANIVSITRNPDALNPVGTVTSIVTITDGTSTVNVSVKNPQTCT